jgi:hypothetical protein
MAVRDEITHEFEAKILWQGEKSWLIETTLPLYGHHKFFLPKSKNVTLDHNESDGDGNFMWKVSDWWMNQLSTEKFWANE